ncbi:MAG TPA: ribosome biogenesis GTPase YlqF [Firmicutes bacterium]|nr:ribosome biogenesis GTPase YlqF [Bacillota bacterium]
MVDLAELARQVDVVIEVRDARIPLTSAMPVLDRIAASKLRFVVLSKADLASNTGTRMWQESMRREGLESFAVNCRTGDGVGALRGALARAGAGKRWRAGAGVGHGMVRAMVAGIPNVGKSSLLNRLAGEKKARVGARPGITRGRQWVMVGDRIALLDTPGVIRPDHVDGLARVYLSAIGAIPDDAVDTVVVAGELLGILKGTAPEGLIARYGPDILDLPRDMTLSEIGRRRGCLGPGGRVDLSRAALAVLMDFREGKLGRVTLETPLDLESPVHDEPDRKETAPPGLQDHRRG